MCHSDIQQMGQNLFLKIECAYVCLTLEAKVVSLVYIEMKF